MSQTAIRPVPKLPPEGLTESRAILKALASAHRYLAELKGVASSIPNQSILIDTLTLQEAKDSSAIENIITTHDEIYQAQLFEEMFENAAAKEVSNYAKALRRGFERVRKQKVLTLSHILEIQKILEGNDAGLRKVPGTKLINQSTNEVVYTPPQDHATIVELMENLVRYINHDIEHDVDALVKMAVIHLQFETIHPFYDGNGRTGRIINILYLILSDLISLPVLYLSRFIIRNKAEYYRLLQSVRDTGEWEEWLLYMIRAVEEISRETIALVEAIRRMMLEVKHEIRERFPKIYSQDLINNLFRHPYTKIEFVMDDLGVSRLTATKYLDILTKGGLLKKKKIWRTSYYINAGLFALLQNSGKAAAGSPTIVTSNPEHGKG